VTFLFRFPGSEQFNDQGLGLEFSSTQFSKGQPIVLKKGDTLNLTCKIISANNDSVPRFRI